MSISLVKVIGGTKRSGQSGQTGKVAEVRLNRVLNIPGLRGGDSGRFLKFW